MTIDRAAMDGTVIVHLLFILFVVAGGLIARRWLWLTLVHLAALAWAVYAELAAGVVCPLTALENHFAARAGLATYREDFVARHLVPVIYQEGLPLKVQYLIVALVLLVNVFVYRRRLKRGR